MSTRRFTVAEANALIVEIRPLLERLITLQTAIDENSRPTLAPLPDAYQNVGSPAASRLMQSFIAVEQLLNQVKSFGCDLKDVRLGLVDFPAEIDGREVNLCWRFDEEAVSHYHDLDEGYGSRRALDGR